VGKKYFIILSCIERFFMKVTLIPIQMVGFSVFSYCPHFLRLSVRPSVRLSVCLSGCLSVRRPHYYFSWGCPIRAIYGSIDSL
jgi:hypothetical protein